MVAETALAQSPVTGCSVNAEERQANWRIGAKCLRVVKKARVTEPCGITFNDPAATSTHPREVPRPDLYLAPNCRRHRLIEGQPKVGVIHVSNTRPDEEQASPDSLLFIAIFLLYRHRQGSRPASYRALDADRRGRNAKSPSPRRLEPSEVEVRCRVRIRDNDDAGIEPLVCTRRGEPWKLRLHHEPASRSIHRETHLAGVELASERFEDVRRREYDLRPGQVGDHAAPRDVRAFALKIAEIDAALTKLVEQVSLRDLPAEIQPLPEESTNWSSHRFAPRASITTLVCRARLRSRSAVSRLRHPVRPPGSKRGVASSASVDAR